MIELLLPAAVVRRAMCPVGPPMPEGESRTVDALALPATAGWHCIDGARITLVRLFKRLPSPILPRYTGAGDTSIHKAICDAERRLREGNRAEGVLLLIELRRDLTDALAIRRIESLMDKWNQRYPSDKAVDLLLADIDQLLRYINAHFAPFHRMPEEDSFTRSLKERIAVDLQEDVRESGYESLGDLLADQIASENVETVFQVKLRVPFDAIFGRPNLSLTVRGRPNVAKLIDALPQQYPLLQERRWGLAIRPPLESAGDTVLPAHELELIEPTPDAELYWGPANRSVWATALVLMFLVAGNSDVNTLAYHMGAILLVAYGVLTDAELWGRRPHRLPSWMPQRAV
jgi:hypothetical protein